MIGGICRTTASLGCETRMIRKVRNRQTVRQSGCVTVVKVMRMTLVIEDINPLCGELRVLLPTSV